MKNNNNAQNIQIARIETDLGWLKNEFASIKHMVSNDIPHQIEDLKNSFNSYKSSQSRWTISILITLVFTLLALVLNLIK